MMDIKQENIKVVARTKRGGNCFIWFGEERIGQKNYRGKRIYFYKSPDFIEAIMEDQIENSPEKKFSFNTLDQLFIFKVSEKKDETK